MNINVYHQLFNLIAFVLTGILIGFLFDIFRVMRKSFKTPDLITYIEDIIFWILTGLILLFTIFVFNNGEIRIYIFVGLFLGLCIYILTLSKYFIQISVKIVTSLKKILYFPICTVTKIVKIGILQPFKSLIQKVKRNYDKINKKEHPKNRKCQIP